MDEKWREWYETVLLPLVGYDPNQPLSPALQALLNRDPAEVDLALLAADTDRIQEYVFESARLPEIRGGSELLRRLNEEDLPRLVEESGLPSDDCVLYSRGGSFLALLPTAVAESLSARIEQLYPQRTGAASITCVWQSVSARNVLYGLNGHHPSTSDSSSVVGFGGLVQTMGILLRRRKEMPAVRPFIEAIPFAVRCQMCQLRPAETMYRYFEEDNQPLCFVCRQKANAGGVGRARQGRSAQVNRFLKWLKNDAPEELSNHYWQNTSAPDTFSAQDLSELGAVCQAQTGRRYIGFIYADGNQMGRVLESLPAPATYRYFSNALSEAVKIAVYQALAENLHPARIERVSPTGRPLGEVCIHPFEPLVSGGDDVMLFTPGHVALPTAVRLAQLFEREMEARAGDILPHPTLSVGVVIADSHNPVRVLQNLAQDLCKRAKKRAHHEAKNGHPTSTIDYFLLKSQSMLRRDIDQLRRTPPYYYEGERTGTGLRLTAAPFTLAEACTLLTILKTMRRQSTPMSQLQSLVAALHRGQQYSSVYFLYQQARAQEKAAFIGHLTEYWPYDPKLDPIPWHRSPEDGEKILVSILPDLLDLYPLVPRFADLPPTARAEALDNLWQPILKEANRAG